MQLLFEVANPIRVAGALALGAAGKLIGDDHLFWEVIGPKAKRIEGFVPEESSPYHSYALLPLTDPQRTADRTEKLLGRPIVIFSNRFGLEMLGKSGGVKLADDMLARLLPNLDDMTGALPPLVVIKRKGIAFGESPDAAPEPEKKKVLARLTGLYPAFIALLGRIRNIQLKKFWGYFFSWLGKFPRDVATIIPLVFRPTRFTTSLRQRFWLVVKCYRIAYSQNERGSEKELLRIIFRILNLRTDEVGPLLLAGCGNGSKPARFSLASALTGRPVIFADRFQKAVNHPEYELLFGKGKSRKDYLDDIIAVVRRLGSLKNATFLRGEFEETLKTLGNNVRLAYVEADNEPDLLNIVKHLYPKMCRNGEIFVHAAGKPWAYEMLYRKDIWDEMTTIKPKMSGSGRSEHIVVHKR